MAQGRYHKVQPGDTMERLGGGYIGAGAIAMANGRSTSQLRTGETIWIPDEGTYYSGSAQRTAANVYKWDDDRVAAAALQEARESAAAAVTSASIDRARASAEFQLDGLTTEGFLEYYNRIHTPAVGMGEVRVAESTPEQSVGVEIAKALSAFEANADAVDRCTDAIRQYSGGPEPAACVEARDTEPVLNDKLKQYVHNGEVGGIENGFSTTAWTLLPAIPGGVGVRDAIDAWRMGHGDVPWDGRVYRPTNQLEADFANGTEALTVVVGGAVGGEAIGALGELGEVGSTANDLGLRLSRAVESRAAEISTQGSASYLSRSSRGPVLSGVMDSQTGQIYFGLNSGEVPTDLHSLLQQRLADYLDATGNMTPVKAGVPGSHSEVAALNQALRAREALTGVPITEGDLPSFLMQNRSLMGSGRVSYIPPRCANCATITRGVTMVGGM